MIITSLYEYNSWYYNSWNYRNFENFGSLSPETRALECKIQSNFGYTRSPTKEPLVRNLIGGSWLDNDYSIFCRLHSVRFCNKIITHCWIISMNLSIGTNSHNPTSPKSKTFTKVQKISPPSCHNIFKTFCHIYTTLYEAKETVNRQVASQIVR